MAQILVGVDGSAEAAVALRWAVAEGERRHQPVVALLVFDWLHQVHAPGEVERFDLHYDKARADAELQEIVAAAIGPDGGAVERRTVIDLPGPGLVSCARQEDLLVVGHRGKGRTAEALGSVSSHVAHHACCPVALVPPAIHDTERARVVVGVDGSQGSIRALRWAAHEARVRGAELELVCAETSAASPRRFLAPQATAAGERAEAVFSTTREVLQSIGLGVTVVETAYAGAPGEVLLTAADRADLVVVGSRGRGLVASALLGSVSADVARHAPCPAVVVPGADARDVADD